MYSPPIGVARSRIIGRLACCLANAIVAIVIGILPFPAEAADKRAIVLEVDGVIGPAIADYVVRELRSALFPQLPGAVEVVLCCAAAIRRTCLQNA